MYHYLFHNVFLSVANQWRATICITPYQANSHILGCKPMACNTLHISISRKNSHIGNATNLSNGCQCICVLLENNISKVKTNMESDFVSLFVSQCVSLCCKPVARNNLHNTISDKFTHLGLQTNGMQHPAYLHIKEKFTY